MLLVVTDQVDWPKTCGCMMDRVHMRMSLVKSRIRNPILLRRVWRGAYDKAHKSILKFSYDFSEIMYLMAILKNFGISEFW